VRGGGGGSSGRIGKRQRDLEHGGMGDGLEIEAEQNQVSKGCILGLPKPQRVVRNLREKKNNREKLGNKGGRCRRRDEAQ